MNKREQAQKKVLGNCFVCGGSRSTQSHGSLSGWIFRFNPCTCNSGTGNSASTVRETPEIDFDLDAIELPDRFDFVELIGQGGMGTVLKVNDRVSGEALALKLLIADHLEDPVAIRRFEQEADAAACLSHPNLVAVRDYGLLNTGAPYLAMEYLEGDSLADILERQVFLDQEEAFDIFIQICNAMGHAHFRGVIHRDLKPSNVMVSVKEGVSTVKIVDFGIARFIGSDGNTISNITRTGEVFGSPEYMSPEQCKGEYLDHRTDIYSLGCVMYECLTGRTPFAAPNAVKTILKQLNESAEGFRKRYRFLEISQEMELIVCQCLRKNPDLRYQHMEEVAKDLEFVRAGRPPRVATDQRLRRRHGKLSRSHKAGIGLIIAMSIAPYLHFFDSYDTITALFKFVVSLFLQSCFLASLF
ncbi:MAG: serine/threonine protein kinase, partial [Candidatus Obscuribacterales bacterium]|nr:serine/threonine protein kinase [Candidatus Obscuribacterales bacterium]